MPTNNSYEIRNEYGSVLLRLYHSAVKPEKRAYREHHHTEFEIALVKQGCGVYRVGEKTYDIRAGDVFLFSTDEVHCVTEIGGDEEMVLMNVHFAPRFVWSQTELFDTQFLKIFFHRSRSFENRIARDNPSTAKIARLLLNMEAEFQEGKNEYELMVKIQLLTILVELIRGYDYVAEGGAFRLRGSSFGQMAKAMDYIDAHLTAPLSLEKLAGVAGINKTYFSTLFKKLNGMSPWDYITVKRVDRARRLLRDEHKTVLDAALESGFNNTANFNRAFRKVTGKTPREIRG